MHQYRHILFLDIETVPITDDYGTLSERMQKEWERKAKFIRSDSTEPTPEELFNDRSGVFAEFAKVVCICFGSFSEIDGEWVMRLKSIANVDENLLLKEFADTVSRFHAFNQNMAFCGHNIKEFDIPFLCRRMLINGIQLPSVMDLSGKKPWENPHIDTMELWKFGDYKNYTSLSLLAEILGIPSPKDDIDGSMVASVFYKDNDLPRIVEYCVKDVVTSAKVFFKLKGQVVDFETVIVN